MPWPWHKKGNVVFLNQYVPVHRKDGRTFQELWADESFLERVAGFRGNDTFIAIVAKALSNMREVADTAKTPEELAGCNEGIKHLKWLLTLPANARDHLNRNREQLRADEQADRDNL